MWGSSVVLLISMVLAYYLYTSSNPTVPVFTKQMNSSYDYIIVGAGSAGCVVASRLSEDAHVSVLLIEAGGYDLDKESVYVPARMDELIMSSLDWGYRTVPQKHSHQSHRDKRGYWPRGRTLGGTSSINLMVYMRGSRHDYDGWADNGAAGWSYKEVLPYFIKSEDVQDAHLKQSAIHSTGGPLKVSEYETTGLSDIFIRAGQMLGFEKRDCNDGDQEGVCRAQGTIGDGVRSSTAQAFLLPVLGRKNLHISLNTHVTKILLDNKKAVGVEFVRDGRKQVVHLKKEVILSAGAIGSPQILMLSGIGPKKHLQKLKIPVVAALPVGENLQDHMFLPAQVDTDKPSGYEDFVSPWPILQYALLRTGLLAGKGMCDVASFFKTNPKDEMPDIQFQVFASQFRFIGNHSFLWYLDEEIAQEVYLDTSNRLPHGFFVAIIAPQHPRSTGTIRLTSRDPFDYPQIDPHYLEDISDVHSVLRGIRILQQFLQMQPFKDLGARLWDHGRPFSRCKDHVYDTDEYWICQMRHIAMTGFHHSCTCKMGSVGDPKSVVDPQLRVQGGISGVRVADASVMPFVTSANTNAPIIMIAEKVSDMIRGIDSVDEFRKRLESKA